MKIATWNVNSLRVRLEQVLHWLSQEQPDVLCLQETKTVDEQFPVAAFENAGYHCRYSGQKTYNGVAIISRQKPAAYIDRMDNLSDPQKRFLGIQYGQLCIFSVYVPNGESPQSEKFQYKLAWLTRLTQFLQSFPQKSVVVAGDFNIAPTDQDVYYPVAWKERILCSTPERRAFQTLLDVGLSDSFRLFTQPPQAYTWWDYRTRGFSRNHGLRIDHLLVSNALIPHCSACRIDIEPRKAERPSDHTPVILTLDHP